MTPTLISTLHTPAPADSAGLRLFIGVDGGGTGTRLKLAGRDGQILAQAEAGPSALGQGPEQAWRHIQQAVQKAAASAGLAPLDPALCAIGLGLSGVSVTAQAQAFVAQQPGYAALALDGDGFTTVLGAHGGQPGAVVAAGTGTVGEALRRDGSRVMSSGWGYITGDEGSGAWLGLQAMRHAQQALDGRTAMGALAAAVWSVAGSDRPAILAWCAAAGQHGFASLAPLVFDNAAADPLAASLIAQAVAELERLALALDPRAELPLALAGSIALRLAPEFSPALQARLVPAQGDSADGALLLIRQSLGLTQNRPSVVPPPGGADRTVFVVVPSRDDLA